MQDLPMADPSTLSASVPEQSFHALHPSNSEQRSAFRRALDQYIQDLPEKRQKGRFILACTDAISIESIHEIIKRAEEKKTAKGAIEKVLTPVVNVLKDYDGIINSLVSADPMPTAIIWGALKVVVDGAHRFTNLFETIRTELELLASQLRRINIYEDLYGGSGEMQDLLCKSYINMLRFWSRVDKECCRPRIRAVGRAVTSFSTNKLNKIISSLKCDADEIQKMALLVESRMANSERKYTELERSEARLARLEQREEHRAWRECRVEQLNAQKYDQIRSWIGSQKLNDQNSTQHRKNKENRLHGTYDWLATHPAYTTWEKGITSVLWLHAPPGFGKSTVCSHAVKLIQDSDPKAVVVYHFCRFDRAYSGCETLQILAGQLFESYGMRSNLVNEELYLNTQRRACSLENVQELIMMLVKSLPKTYFFIDGLDEEATHKRWAEASGVVDFLIRLSMEFPDIVRVWYSSQHRPRIHDKLNSYLILDVEDQVRADVMLYLSRALSRAHPELDELEEEKNTLLEMMQKRSEGNFLCASLMIDALDLEANSLADMRKIINRLPKNLNGYYRRIFDLIEKPQRRLACIVFALIAFARRPLRMKEIREAAGLLQSKTPHSPKAADMPFITRLKQLFAPLIEVQEGCSDDDMDDCTCRLFHSTVRDFLVRNPEVLAESLPITPRIIADACLHYLSQSRYTQLLIRSTTGWIDTRRETVDQQHFLLYAAKYWDKHLDNVPESKELHKRVLSFITSSNFQTCVQVQSLWVDGKFNVFGWSLGDARHRYLLRVFPKWFTPRALDFWKDYRRFVHDWRHLLSRENDLSYSGEVDRCWWGALGPRNFLSRLQDRYASFLLQVDGDSHHGRLQGIDGVNETGEELKILRLHSRDNDTLKFICEHWSLPADNRTPTLEKTQTILAQVKATNWLLYTEYSGNEPVFRVGKAAPAMFSSDCQFLRIGAQLFALDDQGAYAAIPGLNAQSDAYPAYSEEFATRGPYVVLTTRRNITIEDIGQSGIPDGKILRFGADFTRVEEAVKTVLEWSDDEGYEVASESDSSCASSTDSNDPAYETWSECSSEHSEDSLFEDDFVTPWTTPADIEEVSLSDSSQSSGEESQALSGNVQSEESISESDHSEDSDLPAWAVVKYSQWYSDDEDHDSDRGGLPRQEIIAGPRTRGLENSLAVFDTRGSVPRRIFHFSRAVSFILYASPPVLHPSKALVVWPLSGGDVLFADFVANTYFVRRLRPSTSHTRHIFMKCHFSHCGQYLHIASLEGQRDPASSSRRNANQPGKPLPQPSLKIALLLSTYRLCGNKTTKAPPAIIHRAKIHLGSQASLSVSKLPYTLTWTSDELYFTCSADSLRVYRIHLFNNPDNLDRTWGENGVLMPMESIFLPGTASQREVYYFPPAEGSTLARIIVGSETRAQGADNNSVFGLQGYLSPPIGCYLEEKDDLGGWGGTEARSHIPEDLGIGRLDRRREKFDFDDDCDLEPYIF